MIRFFLIWLAMTALIYVYRYLFSKGERKITRVQVKNIVVSMMISSSVVGVLFLLNNIQGL